MSVATISEIIIASEDKARCDELRKKYSGKGPRITTARVDLNNEQGTKMMLSITNPDVIVNIVPPKFSLTVMKLALDIGADYIDGALYNIGEGDLLAEQFSLFGDFRSKARMAVAGCAMNPAILTSLVRIAMRDEFDTISSADIFEMEISSENPEGTKAVIIENGEKQERKALSENIVIDESVEAIGGRKLFLADNDVIQDFLKEIPGIANVRCFVSYEAEEKPDYTEELNKLGMLSEEPIEVFPGIRISPLEFWEKYQASKKPEKTIGGECAAGVVIEGERFGRKKKEIIYFTGDNNRVMEEYGMLAGKLYDAHALLNGIILICSGRWLKSGVFTPCAFEPDLLINGIKNTGLAIRTQELSPEVK